MSASRTRDNVALGAKLLLFVGLSVILTTVVVTSVLDLGSAGGSTYHAVFSDVSGLQSGDTVRVAGVEVGKVSSVGLLTGKDASRCSSPGTTRSDCAYVTFTVSPGQRLTTTTGAAVRYANLLGQRLLSLTPGPPGGRPLAAGGVIPVSQTQPGLDLTEVFNGFQPLFNALSPGEVNQLSASIISVFQGESGTVSDLVAQTAAITTNLANRQKVLDQVLQNLAGLLDAVNSQGNQLGNLIGNFDSLLSGLAGERTQIASAITGVGQLNTSVASVLSASQPAFNKAIQGLAGATGSLEADQTQLDGLVKGLPGLFGALSKAASTGSYIDVYICNLTINIQGTLNISLVPGVPAPQYPQNLQLPSGPVGNQSQHTRNCG